MTHKLISMQTVVSKVIADLDLSEDNLRISDIIEWGSEALLKIGGISEMNTCIDIIPLNCHQAKLPCDMNKLLQVAYGHTCDGPWRPTRYNTGSFMINHDHHECQDGCCQQDEWGRYIPDYVLVKTYRTMYKKENLTHEEAMRDLNENNELRSVLMRLINNKDWKLLDLTNYSGDIQYYVKPGYVVCNIPNGFLKISYNSVPRDEFGYPMIPDMESYIEAIYWYIVMKLSYPEYRAGRLAQHIYFEAKDNWKAYSRQAYGNIKMPNLDELKSIQNAWLRVYPVLDEHDTFYSNVGQQQNIYNKNGSPRFLRNSGYGNII